MINLYCAKQDIGAASGLIDAAEATAPATTGAKAFVDAGTAAYKLLFAVIRFPNDEFMKVRIVSGVIQILEIDTYLAQQKPFHNDNHLVLR